MSAILDKFDTIEIKNTSRIDAEDQEFCELFNQIYSETLECHKNTLSTLIKLYNKQVLLAPNDYSSLTISRYGREFSVGNVEDGILKLKKSFIDKICYYFEKKYQVTINKEQIHEKYKDKEIPHYKKENSDHTLNPNPIEYVYLDYNMILDQIFIQLNGFTFFERAVDEIKKKAKTKLMWYDYRKHWNYEIKGKTLKFRCSTKEIKSALYFYDSNETELKDCFTYNKVDDFRYFENGNTDIKFIKPEYALEFATKYLGYIEMTEEEREEYKKKCRW